MNHLKTYCKLIRRAEQRSETKIIGEYHHIFPKSIYGNNSRVVKLTYREHYIVHQLLFNICKTRYGIHHIKTFKMASAFHIMIYGEHKDYNVHSSRLYEMARIYVSQTRTNKPRPDMFGKSFFGSTKDRTLIVNQMKETRKRTIEDNKKRTGKGLYVPPGRISGPCSPEKAAKISEARQKTAEKYINMSQEEFKIWLSKHQLIAKDGRVNSNLTRAIVWRGEELSLYYSALDFHIQHKV